MSNPLIGVAFHEERIATRPATTGDAMTVAGVARKTAGLLAVVVASAATAWAATSHLDALPDWYLPAGLAGCAIAVAIAISPGLARWGAPVFAVVEGVLVGTLSRLLEEGFAGIVAHAMLATLVTFVAMLVLYAIGFLGASERFTRFVVGGTAGAVALYAWALLAWASFGATSPFLAGWGGVLFAGIMVGLAAANLVVDFADIDRAVVAGEPAEMEWFAAFGLLVTIVWIYLEILRLLVYLVAYSNG